MPLKLKVSRAGGPEDAQPPTQGAASPSVAKPANKGSGLKIKFTSGAQDPSSAPEPALPSSAAKAGEGGSSSSKKKGKAKDTASKLTTKKRQAEEEISPAAKRINNEAQQERKPSFKLKGPKIKEDPDETAQSAASQAPQAPTPTSAKLNLKKRPPPGPKRVTLNVKREPPPRPKAVGYDSEDSDAERDPMIEQAFMLRMEPGEDCDMLRKAIEEKKIGLSQSEGGLDVRIRFLDKDHRRGIVTIKGRMYAAALVDLPCVIESMKSWDKKGWWKVVDICQMLLVLGRCNDEEEAKNMALPSDVDPTTMKYAHGIAPPFYNVRKRRFRKRVVHRPTEAVEDEVERLLKDDDAAIEAGGEVSTQFLDNRTQEQSMFDDDATGEYDDEADAPGEEEYEEEDPHHNLEFDLEDAFAAGEEDMADDPTATTGDSNPAGAVDTPQPPVPMNAADAAQNPILTRANPVTNTNILTSDLVETPTASTPAAATSPEAAGDNESSISYSSDSDDESAGPDDMDEEQQAANLQRAQQEAEVADLREEVAEARQIWRSQTNRLIWLRKKVVWEGLREQLRVKCVSFGLPFPEGEEEEDAGAGAGA